jgi:hypothetical protein
MSDIPAQEEFNRFPPSALFLLKYRGTLRELLTLPKRMPAE